MASFEFEIYFVSLMSTFGSLVLPFTRICGPFYYFFTNLLPLLVYIRTPVGDVIVLGWDMLLQGEDTRIEVAEELSRKLGEKGDAKICSGDAEIWGLL